MIGISALLVGLVLVVFAQTAGHEFINYDDPECVSENPVVSKGLTMESVGWAFTHSQLGHWDPLTTLSHMADSQLYGLWAGGHHLTNVLLQAAAAVLLFLVLLSMTGALWRCAFAAAVWAIHPLRVESVAWIAERKDVLSGVFFMLTLLAYGWYARRPVSLWRYACVAALFVLGLMSKSMLVTLPLVLLLLDYWPLRRLAAAPGESGWRTFSLLGRLCLEKIPLLLVSIVFAVVQMNTDRKALVTFDDLPLVQRASNAVVSYVVYLGQMVRPVNLGVFYPHPRGTLPVWDVVFAVVVLGMSSAAAILARRKQPWLIVGWLWYLGMLAPVIGIVQSGYIAHADRYTYLPQIGLCIAGTWAAADYAGSHWRDRRAAWGSIAALVLCVLTVAACCQTTFWRNSVTLWSHTLNCAVDNTLARNALGLALLQQGRAEEAIDQFHQAVRINPDFPDTYIHLGKALLQRGNELGQQGRTDEAIAEYRDAIQADPKFAQSHYNLGNALLGEGRTEDAIDEYRAALQSNPGFAPSHFNLGNALLREGQTEEAIKEMEKALELQPADAGLKDRLAWTLATAPQNALRDGAKAVELATQAVQANAGDPSMLRTLAAAFAQAGEFPKAVRTAKDALAAVQAQSNTELADALRREIKLYEAGRPFENVP